jgi:hypothetical protein
MLPRHNLAKAALGIRFNDRLESDNGESKLGLEGIVSKRKGSSYRSGRSSDWLKCKNPACAAVKREAEEDWGKERWRWISASGVKAARAQMKVVPLRITAAAGRHG